MHKRFSEDKPNLEFTRREEHVLIKIAEGVPTDDLAWELDIGQNTVRDYLSQLFEKLNVHDRVELRTWALQHPEALIRGWTPPGLRLHPRGCACGGPYCSILYPILGFKKAA